MTVLTRPDTAAPATRTTVTRRRRRGPGASRVVLYTLLTIGAVVSVFPLYWLFVMASNTTSDIYKSPPVFVPGPWLFQNIGEVFQKIDFGGALLNTVIVSVSVTVLVLFFDSLAAFTFAKFDFPFRKTLFTIVLVTFMLPMQLSIIPQFITMTNLGWVGHLQALIVPAAANAFGIFWLRQYILSSIPDELLDAAVIDGAGFFRQWWTVCIPLIRPGLGFLGIFTFIGSWNDYLWPLIVLNDPNHLTLQVAMAQLNTTFANNYSMVMAGALLSVLPLLVVFLIGARQFIGDIAKGAIK
ncbi:carbohydrate ABC transporter permease [Curtobacterium sp. C1]|uniref:Carbohydrate ABC transporter permease n=1 Tax=Curtobacterium citreum TaxID=2036 RepID=A0ABT2HCX3_9MICO|nr:MULTISPECIES: carbohydrate ABC transporter permease [Curtobacterium]MCS5487767.1 carbohydrate ABC transporter permease [Curtobacterium flaccumfaciens pv. basellae]MCS6521075.1 carbohydrate ABC transporter permease [Curtobacterium citreum]MDK8172065.1 carbohydrate ABC transporter permease [Curtobacterium citreum]RDH96130.1 carbohydrate ABC transporter membrane protein 2 (CUT1 family) [Curtobacterium sp. AG1037]TQJ27929.1 carbohydrate ABC transporter membrane protein 2 (CUT1 family) [Curtobac